MTYGVDQCRRCGRRIKGTNPDALRRYEESLRAKKPTMTPKQWKALGWKAAPTRWQTWNDLDGVCYQCKPKVVFRRPLMRIDLKFFWLFSLIAVMFGLIWFFGIHTL